jgi:hypothetical protein
VILYILWIIEAIRAVVEEYKQHEHNKSETELLKVQLVHSRVGLPIVPLLVVSKIKKFLRFCYQEKQNIGISEKTNFFFFKKEPNLKWQCFPY